MVFKNRYGELRSGWAVAAAMALIILGLLIAQGFAPDGKEDDFTLKAMATLIYGLLVIGGGLLLFKLIYKRNPAQMGIIREGWFPGLLYGFGMGIVSTGITFIVLFLSGQAIVAGINISRLLSFGIIIELISVSVFAFSEELIARGFIMTAFKTTRNKLVIISASSVIFALAHLLNPGIAVLPVINTFLAGLLFAYMFVRSGKLWLSAGFHISWNFMLSDILGMSVSGNEQTGVLTTQMGTNQLLSGGAYGPEGGLIVTGVLMLALLYVHFVIKTPAAKVWTMTSDLPLTRGSTE